MTSTTNTYTDLQPIGSGDYAVVYRATLAPRVPVEEGGVAAETVAIRFLKQGDEKIVRAEAAALSAVSHPNIVRILEVTTLREPGSDDDVLCVVMEYVAGATLSELLEHEMRPEIALTIGRDLVSGVSHTHHCQITLGDLHDNNVLVTFADFRVKIVDPGGWRHFSEMRTHSREVRLRGDFLDVAQILEQLLFRSVGTRASREFDRKSRSMTGTDHLLAAFEKGIEDGIRDL